MTQKARMIIAGTNSGCGKTTIVIGILAALKKMGLQIQPIKIGPDYIDPMFHSYVSKVSGKNLDSFLMDDYTISSLFQTYEQSSQLTILEGVMGLFDGLGIQKKASTAEMAKKLEAPVILVMNATGMSVSIAAVLNGFSAFDSDISIQGVLFSRVKSPMQYQLLKEIVLTYTNLIPLGYLSENTEFSFPSRHLGLIGAAEIPQLEKIIEKLSMDILEHVELEKLLQIAYQAPPLPKIIPITPPKQEEVSIAVALDNAFSFYYSDNLNLLEQMGAKLQFFSPLTDKRLPECQGLYLGGGYPELFARQLEENLSLREDIRKKLEQGLVAYAECGGLMYLSETIVTKEQEHFSMVGFLKGTCQMGDKLRHFGYVKIKLLEDSILGKANEECPAHEFHYSIETLEEKPIFLVQKERDRKPTISWYSGYKKKNTIASYPHIHFYSNRKFAETFLNHCRKGKRYE